MATVTLTPTTTPQTGSWKPNNWGVMNTTDQAAWLHNNPSLLTGAALPDINSTLNSTPGLIDAITGRTPPPVVAPPQTATIPPVTPPVVAPPPVIPVTATPPAATIPAATPPQTTNNTAMITQQNDVALQSTIAAIKAAVQQAKGAQQQIIQKAPEEYGNLKNVVYGQSLAGLPGMRENTANLGASTEGGYSRTTETKANSDLQNRLGELDRQKQTVIDQANFAISDLESKGMFDEANATKESALSKLQMIVAESSRLDTLNSTNYWAGQNLGISQQQINNQTSQFGVTSAQNQQQINNQTSQFGVTSAQNQKQIDNQMYQFVQSFGLSAQELTNTIKQQGIDNVYRDKAFAQAADQFAQQMGLSKEQFAATLSQWAKTFTHGLAQDTFNNGINATTATGYAPKVVSDLYPEWAKGNSTTPSGNVVSTTNTGGKVYYSPPSSTKVTKATVILPNGNTKVYDNGPKGFTEYNPSGTAVRAGVD